MCKADHWRRADSGRRHHVQCRSWADRALPERIQNEWNDRERTYRRVRRNRESIQNRYRIRKRTREHGRVHELEASLRTEANRADLQRGASIRRKDDRLAEYSHRTGRWTVDANFGRRNVADGERKTVNRRLVQGSVQRISADGNRCSLRYRPWNGN